MKYILIGIIVYFVSGSVCVDHNIFKNCSESSFCSRCRSLQSGTSKFNIESNTVQVDTYSVKADIVNTGNNQKFTLLLQPLVGETFRLQIDEKEGFKPRYRVKYALQAEPQLGIFSRPTKTNDDLTVYSGINKVIVKYQPFKVEFYSAELLTVTVNDKGLMQYEHLRQKPSPVPEDQKGWWEEDYKGWLDSKPKGPEALGIDFTFNVAQVLFGIPEHADSFALRVTRNGQLDPYRLYNLDVPNHDVDSTMALYGSVPILYGHGVDRTAGVFWHNAAETWVDIYPNPNNASLAQAANFFSESGIIDAFIILGANPNTVFKQYTDLTGVTALPQAYSLGYHQCRWNYDNRSDLLSVNEGFNTHNIPMDTLWLDIEYTDGKRYFTWDQVNFTDPLGMIQIITDNHRHLNIIIDIHIKQDTDYSVYKGMFERNLFTNNSANQLYVGECWPGLSCYPDVLNEEARKYLADQYLLNNFVLSTDEVMIWNDMNEPSTFNGPEKTFPKDNIHYENWEHRDIHNIYGHLQLVSTFDGLSRRSNYKKRPFILTRSHFSGSQRYAAIWTGDNTADWAYLKVAVKTCLSQAVSGFSFCGADVGGFFGHPTIELFERWYQAAAFQPFYRSHANLGTPRREPWLFGDEPLTRIRNAIRLRYTFIPFWYTLFYEHEQFGLPIMRPLLSLYPRDKECFAIDNSYLLSNILLIRLVDEPNVSEVDIYFPSSNNFGGDLWYEIDNFTVHDKSGHVKVQVNRDKIPVYQRGGTIIPRKDSVLRKSALEMKDDPYTFNVCLDRDGRATGSLYIDDEQSYDYRNGLYIYQKIQFSNNILSKINDQTHENYETKSNITKVVVAGLKIQPKSVRLLLGNTDQSELKFEINDHAVVVNLNVNVRDEWTITFSPNSGNLMKISSMVWITWAFIWNCKKFIFQ